MSPGPTQRESDRDAELAALVSTLHETHERIRQLTGDSVDSVVHSTGTTYLLQRAQGELRESESAHRQYASERAAVLDALPANIALLDEQGRIRALNAAWRSFASDNGYIGKDHALGTNYIALCEQVEGEGADEAARVGRGIRAVLAGESTGFRLEYPCHAPSQARWFSMSVTPLAGSPPTGAVVMHVDITERVRAHERESEMQRRLMRLVNQAKVGILVHVNFRPVLVNPELARMLGYDSVEEVMALGDSLALFTEDEQERITAYNSARRRGEDVPELYRVKGLCKDGHSIVMDNRAFTIQWGDQMAVCAMVTDVTEQLETEAKFRQSQRLQAVGQLTGGVAHDFNNLLTIILGNAEVLEDVHADEPRSRALAETTRIAAERGAELTRRLLAFARQQALEPRATDVHALVAGMDGLLRRTLEEKIHIKFTTANGLWPAFVDGPQLENAVLNLSLNARDAMPHGGTLTLALRNARLKPGHPHWSDELTPGEYVQLTVSDTGTGMPPDVIPRVIEPFFTTKKTGEGTGLGLSMVYGFVRQSDGSLQIESRLGRGSEVTMYLPRASRSDAGDTTGANRKSTAGGAERVLLVEDDRLVREHVAAQLSSLGYTVRSAGSGPEALDMLREDVPVDILFTDIVLPGGINGRQLADEARRLRPGLPVLFTSGYTEDAVIHDGRLDEGVDLLQKPYRRQELARRLRDVLDRPVSGG